MQKACSLDIHHSFNFLLSWSVNSTAELLTGEAPPFPVSYCLLWCFVFSEQLGNNLLKFANTFLWFPTNPVHTCLQGKTAVSHRLFSARPDKKFPVHVYPGKFGGCPVHAEL